MLLRSQRIFARAIRFRLVEKPRRLKDNRFLEHRRTLQAEEWPEMALK